MEILNIEWTAKIIAPQRQWINLMMFVMYFQPGFIIYNEFEIFIKWCVFVLLFHSLSLNV